ncbi:MAG: METTL5 family protein [Halobacteriales archaeon]|nr:METTL5 family protein [Halobacteriales archaeon]
MASKRALEGRLAELSAFAEPDVDLEQYATPAPLAATLIHLADLEGDLERPVVDLGAGTGVLALGAAMRGARRVVGIERDRAALETARANETVAEPATSVDWVLADATRPPIKRGDLTVLMNPPFGAQHGHQHADRAFLEVVAELASVSYSIHNDGSWEFVEAFSVDNGGLVTHAYQSTIDLDRQFPFHTEESREHPVEVFRIEWG